MDVKNIAFKWFDKILLLIALAFAAYAFTEMKPSPRAKELEQQAQDKIQVLKRKLKQRPKDLKLEKYNYARDFARAYEAEGDVPPRARTAWYPPRDMIHTYSVMRTQETMHLSDRPIKGEVEAKPFPKKKLGKVTTTLTADKKGLKIKGEQEGTVQLTFYDVMGQRHVTVVTVTEFIPDPKVYPPRKPDIELVSGSKTVKLTWEPPDARDDRAPIQGYNVYRKKKGAKKFERLQPMVTIQIKGKMIPGGTYEDSNTAFDETYEYAVSSYAPNAIPPESPKSATVDIYIPSDIEFFMKSATPPRNGGRPTANIKIHKWVKDYGGWMSQTYFTIKIGQEIGTFLERSRILDGKRQRIKVDYRTGCFLVDVQRRVPVRTFRFGRFGERPADYIVYLDKKGNLKEKWSYEQDAAPWGRFGGAPPERAPRRGRPRAGRRRPGDLEEDLRAPDMEKEARRAEAEAQREEEDRRRMEKEQGAERPEEIR